MEFKFSGKNNSKPVWKLQYSTITIIVDFSFSSHDCCFLLLHSAIPRFYVLGIWHWVSRCSWNLTLWNSNTSSGKHFVHNQSELYQLCNFFEHLFGVLYVLRCCSADLCYRQWLVGSLLPLCGLQRVYPFWLLSPDINRAFSSSTAAPWIFSTFMGPSSGDQGKFGAH